jgi:hypothetical protein
MEMPDLIDASGWLHNLSLVPCPLNAQALGSQALSQLASVDRAPFA